MHPLSFMTRSRLGRRLALLCLACALLPVLVFASWQVREAARDGREHQALQLAGRSQALAESLTARLAAADALAAVLSEPARGDDIARLRAEAARSGVFTRVLVGETELAAVPRAAPAASAGGSALVSLATNGGASSIYVARAFGTAREPAYFEVSPAWLWQELARADAAALVVDADGTILWRAAQAEAGANAALVVQQAARSAGGDHSLPSALGWQSEQREWRGATAAVRMPPTLRLARDWSVATWAAAPMPTLALRAVLSAAAVVFLLALLLAGVASFWMTRRLLPSWLELEAAVARLGVGRFSPVDRERQPAELLPLADAVNAAGVRLDDEVRALETLAEIDRMLLGATELEPVLDAILRRATGVVRCDGVGIALLDTDSPVHGRVLVASASALSLPVARVEFDPEMIEHLLAAEEGITVARSEQQRHSFLLPMRELGCEFFWVWPVAAAGRLVAVLSMGFREAPASDPRIARRGSSFAERLAVALSKTAREEHLYRQAHFDPLTALPNRLLFRDRLEQELASAGDTRSRGALLYIDLDHFKRVNDGVGHAAGDQLLQIVAQRLRACVKEGDTVARLGGDEFTVILRNVQEPESAAVVAERIIDSVRVPVSLGGRDHHVQASIGIALFPDDGANLDELLRNADLAMYRAKELGRHRAVFFDRKLMMSRFDTTHSGLYRALRRREFSLYYQPQFSLGDGRLVGVEALLRWQTPRDGTRTPQEFIPAAEASGLIVDIGGWVLEAACAQFAAWRAEGIAPARISVNVSVQQLKAADFPRTVRRVLDKHGIPAGLVEIELTESVFADDVAGQAMRQLAELGVRLALDDFGTGYSSLNYLRQHPIHVIKIDRSFLDEVPLNESSATLASTIITMAHALGKEVVAEGVERVEQLDFLRERGCDLAQGFYLAQPLPAAQLLDLLRSQPAAGDLRGPASEGPLREVG